MKLVCVYDKRFPISIDMRIATNISCSGVHQTVKQVHAQVMIASVDAQRIFDVLREKKEIAPSYPCN